MFKRSLVCCVALAAAPLARAEEPGAPQPDPGHQRLGYFVGTWDTVGEFKPGPSGPGGPMTMVETCEWFDGRFAIVCRAEGAFPSGPNRSIGLLSYNSGDGRYTYYSVDNSGLTMTTVSRGTVDGDTWTWEDESPLSGRTIRTRVTMREISSTQQSFRMEARDADGRWTTLIESMATKRE